MKKFFNRIYNNQAGQLLFSVILAGLFFLIAYLTHGVYWHTNDDKGIIGVVSGSYNGTPSFSYPFLNAFLGYFFSSLYGITTSVPWYSLFYALVNFISVVIIFRSIFLACSKKNISAFVPVISCALIFAATFIANVLYMSFTVNSVMAGCAAIGLLFAADMNSENKLRYAEYFLSGIFVILSFMIRYKSGQVIACFWALTLVYIVIKSLKGIGKDKLKKIAKSAISLIIVLFIAFSQHSLSTKVKNAYETEGYLAWNTYRSKYIDYTTVSWDSNQQFYEELGWDENFFNLAKNWFFMDERFDLEDLKAINAETVASGYGKWTLKEGVYSFGKLVITEPVALSLTVIAAALFITAIVVSLLSKDKYKKIINLLFVLCVLGGAGILCLYSCMGGRLFLRVYQTIMLPAIVALSLVIVSALDGDELKKCGKISKRLVSTVVVLLVAVAVGCSLITVGNVYNSNNTLAVGGDGNSKQMLVDYAANNPENLYIYSPGFSSSLEAFSIYDSSKPNLRNTISWGGCGMYSKGYYDLLKLHGYDEFYSKNFYDENVYLALNSSKIKDIVQGYLEANFGPTEMVEVYRTEYFVVYDVNKI